ncbi:MAG: galactose-1-phosphate uridylyltransferase [Thermodesulfovibrionales bacterium]|nr:galactose-1-phosphate uridylyltransferase [Thermodesulfovibrionales bacterium]
MLCPGNECNAPSEIFSIKNSSLHIYTQAWKTRVIPKPEPVFQTEGDLGRKGVGMYDKMNSIGANEIVIESPLHDTAPEDIGIDQMTEVIKTYRYRIYDLEKDPRFRYTLIYKDHGRITDDIYEHPHSQIIATPVIPKGIKEELDGATAYYQYRERCIFCDIINEEEIETGSRIIMETNDFIAFTPFAPKFSFEYWILPKRHNCAFQDINDEELQDLSLILTTTLKKMKSILKNPPYVYVLHTAPNRMPRKDHWHTLGDDYHWHMEIMPQVSIKNAFEIDAEFYILLTSPEDAALYLREAEPL